MKRKIEIVIGCILMTGILLIVLNKTDQLTERKASQQKYAPFFEQEKDFDVLFFGSSHTLNGVFPMELWNDYGIVSYNFGGHGNELATTYWVLMNALDYTTPKLVVIDCMMLSSNEKLCGDFDYVHLSFDAFPLSKNKIRAVNDLVDEKEKKWSLLWDFSVYHNRWNELGQEDFVKKSSPEKGAEARVAVAYPAQVDKVARESKLNGETIATEYLRRIIEECQERNIGVLLTYLPFPANETEQEEANRVYDIAKEYGVQYLNFLDINVVDYHTDCYDSISHLNPSGARKVTEYLGKYITKNYDIPDQRMNSQFSDWDDAYQDYENYKVELLKKQTSLYNYLMLLADKSYKISIEVNNAAILKDELLCELLNNLGIDIRYIIEEGDKPDMRVSVIDRKTQEQKDLVGFNISHNYSAANPEILRQ